MESSVAGASADTEQGAREVTERWMEGWNEKDADKLIGCLADQFHYTDPAWHEPITDGAGVRAFTSSVWRALPDIHFTEPHGISPAPDGRTFVIPWRFTGTFTGPLDPPGYQPTGDRFEIDGVDVFEVRDGKITRLQTIYDAMEIGRTIGLIPARGSRGERMSAKVQGLMAKRRRR